MQTPMANATALLLLLLVFASLLALHLSPLVFATPAPSPSQDEGGDGNASPPEPSPRPRCGCEQFAPPPSDEPQPSDFADVKLYQAYRVIQRFKRTITCDPRGITTSWSGADICGSYQGIFCDRPPDNTSSTAVAAVDFNGYALCAPTLSSFLDELPDLAFFHANSNNFTGVMPDLSKLPFLYELDVSNNRFTGPFPLTVLAVPRLLFLDIRYNAFSGIVPSGVFSIALEVLFLNNNQFDNPLPSNLGSTTAKYLTLANNGFTGPIPASIGAASGTLTEALLLGNELSGCLPYEIGLLRLLTLFDAGNNRLTGPIPYSFGCLAALEELNLAGNLMYGTVPEPLCRLGNLQNLSLSNNYFTNLGPACRQLERKGVLDMRMNCVPGLLGQRPHEECAAFLARACRCPTPWTLYRIPCKLPPCSNVTRGGSPWQQGPIGGGGGQGRWVPPATSRRRVYEALIKGKQEGTSVI